MGVPERGLIRWSSRERTCTWQPVTKNWSKWGFGTLNWKMVCTSWKESLEQWPALLSNWLTQEISRKVACRLACTPWGAGLPGLADKIGAGPRATPNPRGGEGSWAELRRGLRRIGPGSGTRRWGSNLKDSGRFIGTLTCSESWSIKVKFFIFFYEYP